VLSLIVLSKHTASVKGRTIYDNARLLRDSVYYANECNIPLAFITVDQLKAYDRVSHDFLFRSLEAFCFRSSFMCWIRVTYNAVSCCVKVNGWLTAFIDLKRGLRQGCALSMPLYVLITETMTINIRANPNIHGILSLPLKEGGFNVARLELKIKARRLNTLRRLLTGEEAHWKHFTSHFLRISSIQLGKLTLATDFAPRDIDRDVPAFQRELLCAWINHKCYHERTDVPDSLLDIFEEPLFRNKFTNVNNMSSASLSFLETGFHTASSMSWIVYLL